MPTSLTFSASLAGFTMLGMSTLWDASHHHFRPGDPIHRCPVAVHVQSPGHQECANYCLSPCSPNEMVERLHRQLKAEVQRSDMAGTPSLGAVRSMCCTKGGGRCVSS